MTRKILGKLMEEATEVRERRLEDRFGKRQFWEEEEEERQKNRDRRKILCSQELGLVLSFSAAFGKSSQASVADELREREVMRGLSETVEVL